MGGCNCSREHVRKRERERESMRERERERELMGVLWAFKLCFLLFRTSAFIFRSLLVFLKVCICGGVCVCVCMCVCVCVCVCMFLCVLLSVTGSMNVTWCKLILHSTFSTADKKHRLFPRPVSSVMNHCSLY